MRKHFHVVIVGAGFSGTACAVQLMRRGDSALQITLLEAGDRLGRGIAYGTMENSHILNTRAGQMSLISDDWDFIRSNNRTGTPVAPADFVTRRVFGDYIEDTLIETIASAADGDAEIVTKTHARVVDIASRSGRHCVVLADGRSIECNAVILATGFPLPSDPLEPWLPPGSLAVVR